MSYRTVPTLRSLRSLRPLLCKALLKGIRYAHPLSIKFYLSKRTEFR